MGLISLLVHFAAVVAIAFVADRLIKKYWGDEGIRKTWLIMAVLSLCQFWLQGRHVTDLAFALFALWSARPKSQVEVAK